MPSRVLLATPEVTFGEFDCPPGDPLWGAVNANIDKPHVVIPRTHVVIAQQARRPVLCTPNHVVFYRARQLYRRSLRDRRGDRCLWLEVAPTLLDEAIRRADTALYTAKRAGKRRLLMEVVEADNVGTTV